MRHCLGTGTTIARGVAAAALMGALGLIPGATRAGEPIFGYSYLTDTLPAGQSEFEQWGTLFKGKQQGSFGLLRMRSAYERGVTGELQLAGYVNYYRIKGNGYSADGLTEGGFENFVPENHNPTKAYSSTKLESYSVEAIWRLWSPYKDPLGVAFYVEPSLGPENRTLEARAILQKNFIDDRLVLVTNLGFEKEKRRFTGNPLADPADEEFKQRWVKEQELVFTFGAAYRFAPGWSAGAEARRETEFHALNFKSRNKDFTFWSLGPTLHFGAKDWFATVAWQHQLANAKVYSPDIADWRYQGRLYGDEATRNELRVKLGFFY